MDFTQLASQLLSDKLGLDINQDTMKSALTSLLGDGGGGIDFAGLASRMASNGQLGSVLKSWLGDGANDAISADSIMDLLGVLPQIMDKASSGGSLLEKAGGLGGLMGAAKSFLS